MKLAFLSDIHGNAVALEAVLSDVKAQKVDRVFVLGDIAYRGPEPKRALDMVRSLGAQVIKGNADEWTVRGVRKGEVPDSMLEMMNCEQEWTSSRLTEADLSWLDSLPTELAVPVSEALSIHAFHATPDSLFEVVLPDQKTDELSGKLMSGRDASIYIYSHIHLPYVRFIGGKCLVNTGSVGLPFDGLARASYAVVEVQGDRYRISIERVAYDVEQVAAQYRRLEYPNAETMMRVIRTATSPFGK
ncbi:metallophosphoesterase family protein [Brevibacillus massiliensis]|jgi:predicted phosphodiesterase|uniref:metallophosphoesterase family protein n=1 Tax=Brevibacillus massiliensis TaxID=1118054 RepID=UPI0002E286F8|nr:metallophosphoesterase family protein [Brevibacillus massiliensis]